MSLRHRSLVACWLLNDVAFASEVLISLLLFAVPIAVNAAPGHVTGPLDSDPRLLLRCERLLVGGDLERGLETLSRALPNIEKAAIYSLGPGFKRPALDLLGLRSQDMTPDDPSAVPVQSSAERVTRFHFAIEGQELLLMRGDIIIAEFPYLTAKQTYVGWDKYYLSREELAKWMAEAHSKPIATEPLSFKGFARANTGIILAQDGETRTVLEVENPLTNRGRGSPSGNYFFGIALDLPCDDLETYVMPFLSADRNVTVLTTDSGFKCRFNVIQAVWLDSTRN